MAEATTIILTTMLLSRRTLPADLRTAIQSAEIGKTAAVARLVAFVEAGSAIAVTAVYPVPAFVVYKLRMAAVVLFTVTPSVAHGPMGLAAHLPASAVPTKATVVLHASPDLVTPRRIVMGLQASK